jgi:CheY-like chemotaxis protein
LYGRTHITERRRNDALAVDLYVGRVLGLRHLWVRPRANESSRPLTKAFAARILSPVSQVLVVEDNKDLRQLCVEMLTELGYEVAAVANGLDAIAALERTHPAAMILDLRLPGCDGYEVLRKVRQSEINASMPVIVISGAATGRWSLKVGADAYLAKPFDLHQLTTTMRRLIHQTATSANAS